MQKRPSSAKAEGVGRQRRKEVWSWWLRGGPGRTAHTHLPETALGNPLFRLSGLRKGIGKRKPSE